MTITAHDPISYFVFFPPKGFQDADLIKGPIRYIHPNPYLISDEWGVKFEIFKFCLPYDFHSKPVYKEGADFFTDEPIPNDYILEYKHTLVKMTESDVNKAFIKRAVEYYDMDRYDESPSESWYIHDYLHFHYSHYHYDLNNWLEYISQVFKEINKYIQLPQLYVLQIRKLVNNWIAEKRTELSELNGETIEQLPAVKAIKENAETQLELDSAGHKLVFLKELGVIDHLKNYCKAKKPSLNDTEFSKLLAPIIGINPDTIRKGLSGYGQGTNDDPKTQKALQKVKSELIKFGIEL
ncbi:hypothetical protein GVN20_01670 [Runella sp. CRIBMP]|uniref:hypothetical protein n=1 Tax=Runella sp. CRIBMP TaxID=2683261 RepID=UPI0014126C91|nr:hypothetical protein [Runella sp. CRIBMP]NBB18050.1 hypothetical protein [Runella sp. CRIBMP]